MANQRAFLEPLHELIQGCMQHNRASQSRLYELLAAPMLGVCLRYCRNREEAEDVLQEGFIQMFRAIHQFRFEGSFEGWVRRIMVNTALQKIRAKSHLAPVLHLDGHKEDPADQEMILSGLGTKELLAMVQQLSPMYRAVFNLYVFEGLKHREIASLLGISEGTSKSNLSDARNILQRSIKKQQQIAHLK